MRTNWLMSGAVFVGSIMMAMRLPPPKVDQYTYDFGLEDAPGLVPHGGNDYCSLVPGRFLRFEGEDDGHRTIVEVTVLPEVRPVRFQVNGQRRVALTRGVEEREWVDGELAQVSLNYYARDIGTNNIYFFGERVDHYEDGNVVGHEGSWMAGFRGAQPGLFMPALFLSGSRYHQEYAPGKAMDRVENLASGFTSETPAGMFDRCIMVVETTPLEPDERTIKVYARGIGPIADGNLRLVLFRE